MKRFMKKLLVMLCVLTLAGSLVACQKESSNTEKEDTKASEVTTTESTDANADTDEASEDTTTDVASAETAYPFTFKDSFGVEITLEKEPMKIVSVAPNMTEMLYTIGAQDKLVGRTDYCDYPQEVSSVESIGSIDQPDIEKIASLEPDMVIASTHFDEENAKKLAELGIPVVSLYEEAELDGVYDILALLGEVVNHQKEASTAVEEMKSVIDNVTTKVEGLEKPSVYYVVSFGEYGDYTAGGDTFIGKMLETAGGENIAKNVSGWTYTLESLVEADPSIIIIGTGMKEAFVTSEGYKDLTAVKEDHVYEMDINLLERQGYRNAQGLDELAKIIHPEAFK
ncbi:MAG TPA: ABC transporter substrate-binding protein [Lachnospiraceae bacterium]|nr:ABC transporter substrate-binding protein [Lachnospiraceae bacterium]